jgi:hypothetical protein
MSWEGLTMGEPLDGEKMLPVVIISTIVLAAGIGTSLLSELPMVSLYGIIVVIVLLSSMVGALLFLPALMATVEGWRKRSKLAAKVLG